MATPRRLDPREYIGVRQYVLTICTHRRRDYFACEDTVDMVRTQFLRIAERESFELLAYLLMPDHLHALACAASASADLSVFVRLAKQRTGFLHASSTGHRLWQKSYFDRTLRENESPLETIKYIVNNPLRRGLAKSPSAYPHWGSQVYSREEILEYLATDDHSVPAV